MKVRLIPVGHRNESIEYPAIHNAFMRQGPMTESPQTRRAAQASAADSLLAFLKSLPLPDRLIEGCVMALQAVAGASIAFTIARALHTHQPFWAAITAIAVSQHNYVDTRKLSRDQFLGAMVGGVCGLAGTLLGGGYFVAYMATVAAAIIICWVANIGSAARLGGITATITARLALALEHPAGIFGRQRADLASSFASSSALSHLRGGDVVVELVGRFAPTITLVTCGWCSSQASAICATDTPLASAIGAHRVDDVVGALAVHRRKVEALCGGCRPRPCCSRPYLPLSRPPASGLHTIRPSPSLCSIGTSLALEVAPGERVVRLQRLEARSPRRSAMPSALTICHAAQFDTPT
jgi:hypothetical protein